MIRDKDKEIEMLRERIRALRSRGGNDSSTNAIVISDNKKQQEHYGLKVDGQFFVVKIIDGKELCAYDLRSGKSYEGSLGKDQTMRGVFEAAEQAVSPHLNSATMCRGAKLSSGDYVFVRYILEAAPKDEEDAKEEEKEEEDFVEEDIELLLSDILETSGTVSKECIDFVRAFEPLTIKEEEGHANRTQSWMVLDRNNDGHVSLDETAAWVRRTLITYFGEFKGEKLFDKFYPSYVFAFKDAADAAETCVVETKMGKKSSDDYIQKSEFRLLCSYMTIYATMYDAFDTLDYGADMEEEEIEPTMSERLEASGAVSRDCVNFVRAFESLGERTDEGRATRTQSWMVLDRNNDGNVSLDETAAWVRRTLITYFGEFQGEKLFDKFYPSYVFAFRDAADAAETHVVTTATGVKSSDETIQKSEFRLLCSYMTIYATMYDAFNTLDYGADIDEDEIEPTMSERLEASGVVSKDCITIVRAFESLGDRTDEGRATRTQSWMILDRNNDGQVSLEETMKWIEATLEHHTENTTLYKKYRSSFVYAFRDAADAAETHLVETKDSGEEKKSSDDYVQKSEFRLLCGYICIYTVMFDSFRVCIYRVLFFSLNQVSHSLTHTHRYFLTTTTTRRMCLQQKSLSKSLTHDARNFKEVYFIR